MGRFLGGMLSMALVGGLSFAYTFLAARVVRDVLDWYVGWSPGLWPLAGVLLAAGLIKLYFAGLKVKPLDANSEFPVLEALVDALLKLGVKVYVTATVWGLAFLIHRV